MKRWTGTLAGAALLAAALPAAAADTATIAFVPQIVGIPYFNAMEAGGKKAADALGVKFVYSGPVDTNPVDQLQIVQNLIDQGVGAIGVSVLDASSIAPVVEAAKKKGVKLFTADSDAPQSGRAVYVAQATDQGLGETVIDELVKRVGPEGKVGIVSGEATASNLNAWIGFMQARAKAKYPKLVLLAAAICGRHGGTGGADRERPHGRQSRPQGDRRRGLHDLPRRCPGDRDRGQDRQGHRHGLLQSQYGAELSQGRSLRFHSAVGSGRAWLPHGLGR